MGIKKRGREKNKKKVLSKSVLGFQRRNVDS